MYGNKLRKKISWPDLIIYSANPHWAQPCHTYWSSRDLEIIKLQHVKQIYTLLGKEKPIRKLFPPHLIFLTEELLEESLLHLQKLNIPPWHPTISTSLVSHPWEKKSESYSPQAPASRWHCSTPGCAKDVEKCSHVQRFIRVDCRRAKVAFGEKLQQNCWLVFKLYAGILLGSLL